MRTWLLAVLSLVLISTALARDPHEDARIEFLIRSVETLHGGVFIRNGTEYDSKKAGEHLRMKLGKGGERVKTAEDFINGVASKSFFSGKPYQIRLENGKTTDAKPFLEQQLHDFDATHGVANAAH